MIALKERDPESGGRQGSAKQGQALSKEPRLFALDSLHLSLRNTMKPKRRLAVMNCRFQYPDTRDLLISVTRSSRDESIAMTQAAFTPKSKQRRIYAYL